MTRPVGVDLFAGAGGMSLGFEQAGFDIAAAVEFDPVHASAHKFNFPKCTVIPRSAVGLASAELRRLANLEGRSVDVVFGGAPCQGFSLIGQRALNDPRNSLVYEFVRLTVELDARCFVFENVKGLTIGRQAEFLDQLVAAFEEQGYRVRTPWQVLNAAHYNVPQNRHRLFLLGAKLGTELPDYPAQETWKSERNDGFHTGPTCADALGDLPEVEKFSELWHDDSVQTKGWGKPSAYARKMRCLDHDSWLLGYPRIWNPLLLTSSARTAHTLISRRRFSETAPGNTEPVSRFYRLVANQVSNTLRAGSDSSRGGFTSPRPIHYKQSRCITVREMARLHGFPDWFRFHRTKWHGARQVGNAVPPPLAQAVAKEVVKVLEACPEKPKEPVQLGDAALLSMSMADAARYWSVPVPIAGRDRKSGTRKRAQQDIEAERLLAFAGMPA